LMDLDLSMLLILAISSLGVYAIIYTGWSAGKVENLKLTPAFCFLFLIIWGCKYGAFLSAYFLVLCVVI